MKNDKAKTIKRFNDIVTSFFLLAILSPIIIIAFLISLFETKAFPIFIQKRGLSIDRKLFTIYKIRTVKCENLMTKKNGRKFLLSPGYKEKVPKLCKLIRKYGIDELPQLVNVIRGEMSLIGPRPLDQFDLKCLKENFIEQNKERMKLNSKPGILGMWQLYGKRTLGAIDLLFWDKLYDENFSLLLDIKIIVQTVKSYIRTGIKEDSIFADQITTKGFTILNELVATN